MSERIKRYISSGQLVSHSVGDICKYADVAAIEAENARLRRIVEAGNRLVAAMRGSGEWLELRSAYGAAKAQATQQGEKTKE